MISGLREKVLRCQRVGGCCGRNADRITRKMREALAGYRRGEIPWLKGKLRYPAGPLIGGFLLPVCFIPIPQPTKYGFAWWFREYSTDKELERLEKEARVAKRGLWADPNAIPPWEWRRRHAPR